MTEFDFVEDVGAMNEINMIPFIDVMLVLLIVFIITVPVIHHSVNVNLPQASSEPEDVEPKTLRLSVQADGAYFLDESAVDDDQLLERLQAASKQDPQPELRIRGDREVRYERVAQAMAAAHNAGLAKIGFVTQPAKADAASAQD